MKRVQDAVPPSPADEITRLLSDWVGRCGGTRFGIGNSLGGTSGRDDSSWRYRQGAVLEAFRRVLPARLTGYVTLDDYVCEAGKLHTGGNTPFTVPAPEALVKFLHHGSAIPSCHAPGPQDSCPRRLSPHH